MSKINKVVGRQVLDSRGNPTVEVDIYADNIMGRAAVPSGASTGENEAVELRDGGSEFLGKSVKKAVRNINDTISQEIIGNSCFDQESVDELLINLDGTKNKSRLGANAILGVSLACAKLASKIKNIPLVNENSLPETLKKNPKIACVVGLSTEPERLADLRKNRMNSLKETENIQYTDLENIKKEVLQAKRTFQKYKWPLIDVTRKSVEETAASIIKIHEIYLNNAK